jgi:parvulin-like peptidyl-prolyl isomerase
MKHFFIAVVALIATAAAAQQTTPAKAATPSDPTKTAVAVINGEVVTQAKLDALYANISSPMRAQYERNGGKSAFLDNYLRKRLFIQEAMKTGFDRKPDVQLAVETAREGALFDRYVRDVVAAQFTSDEAMRKYYDDHKDQFATPEKRKLWHIILTTAGAQGMAKADAAQKINEIDQQLLESLAKSGAKDPKERAQITLTLFKNAARQYSQDGSASTGGNLGWLSRGSLDPRFEAAAWTTEPGHLSGVIESAFGYHIIYVEDVKLADIQPFETAKPDIREHLLTDHTTEIMSAVTQLSSQLRANGKVSVSPENIK